MPEKFTDLGQRRSLPEHLTGKCVSELVGPGAGSINTGPGERVSYYGADSALTLETSCGRFHPEKHASTAGGWPPVLQIIGDGRTDIDWQWQLRIAASLPTHRNQSLLPIQIFQREHSDLTGAQTQARQDQENRIVAPAHGGLSGLAIARIAAVVAGGTTASMASNFSVGSART
jgi:hypothetical protein